MPPLNMDIDINMDRKCQRCGKPGVVHTKNMEGDGRYCLGCSAKIIEERMKGNKVGALVPDEKWSGRVRGVNFKTVTVGSGEKAMDVPMAYITLEAGVYPGLADHLTRLLKETVYFSIQKVQVEMPGLEEAKKPASEDKKGPGKK